MAAGARFRLVVSTQMLVSTLETANPELMSRVLYTGPEKMLDYGAWLPER